MITLCSDELIAINTIVDNLSIYGLPFLGIDEDSGHDECTEQERDAHVLHELEKKEIIIGNQLTDKGLVLTKLLNDYKKCDKYVFINHLRIALSEEKHAVVIEEKENSTFHITRTLKVTLEKQLILSAPFLQRKTRDRFIPFKKEKFLVKDFDAELDDNRWTDLILLQKHEEQQVMDYRIYYMDKESGYCYDYINQERMEKSPKDIRVDLMELLEIGGETHV